MPRRRRKRLGAFILTHGRPDNVVTLRTLERSGWTGDTWLVVDDLDPTRAEYEARYPGRVLVFDKAAAAASFDTGDLETDWRSVVFARNASIGLARDLGYEYMLQLDDDYTSLAYRFLRPNGTAPSPMMRNMDEACEESLRFLEASGADVVAWSQGGDHMGGAAGNLKRHLLRKAMNVLFLRTSTDLRFLGRINEDVNTYTLESTRGRLFLTVTRFQMNQRQTQSSSGGMTELYGDVGTYVKSAYTVMYAPSCAKIELLIYRDPRKPGGGAPRMHHAIRWRNTGPMILSSDLRKDDEPCPD